MCQALPCRILEVSVGPVGQWATFCSRRVEDPLSDLLDTHLSVLVALPATSRSCAHVFSGPTHSVPGSSMNSASTSSMWSPPMSANLRWRGLSKHVGGTAIKAEAMTAMSTSPLDQSPHPPSLSFPCALLLPFQPSLTSELLPFHQRRRLPRPRPAPQTPSFRRGPAICEPRW